MDQRWQRNVLNGLAEHLGDLLYANQGGVGRWKCESPIESALVLAWVTYWDVAIAGCRAAFFKEEHKIHIENASGGAIDLAAMRGAFNDQIQTHFKEKHYTARTVVALQVAIGAYRVDILAFRFLQGMPMLGPVVIECDGKAFHDATVEQLTRDRARDRELQTSGYPVLRFTGSEIYNNPIGCVRDIEAWFDEASSSDDLDAPLPPFEEPKT